MPTIEIGGVEKNFLIISNFLSNKFDNVSVITTSYEKKGSFSKKINFISINYNFIKKLSRKLKFLIAIFLLMKELCNKKQNIVLSFQANVYCVYLCKIMMTDDDYCDRIH